jgi:hypothetical protein
MEPKKYMLIPSNQTVPFWQFFCDSPDLKKEISNSLDRQLDNRQASLFYFITD